MLVVRQRSCDAQPRRLIRAWAIDVVLAFNETINTADLVAMSGLMADGHRFIDSAGSVTDGKASCIAAWSGFFEAFPDYRNHFEAVEEVGADGVVATGRSSCSVDALDGPADWSAIRLRRSRG